jgi:hypothetical protein
MLSDMAARVAPQTLSSMLKQSPQTIAPPVEQHPQMCRAEAQGATGFFTIDTFHVDHEERHALALG